MNRLPMGGCLALFLAVAAGGFPAAAEKPEDCALLRHHGRMREAGACYEKLITSRDPYLMAEGFWGVGQYKDANEAFRAAVGLNPGNARYKVRWGRLFLERFNGAEAAKLFQEALELEDDYPPALLGLALVASGGFEQKAVEMAEMAVKLDPKLTEARELLARLALEDNNFEKAAAEADKALQISAEALDAMAVRAIIDWLEDKPETPWIDRLLKVNPVYGEAYSLAGHIFVLNRRYEEGIRYYRKAIETRPDLWKAHSELGVNLMRLGEDAEARKHLETAYENGYNNSPTVNTLRLLDSYKNFVTIKSGNSIVKLHRKEAELLQPYFESELKKALATFEKKYKIRLNRPVQLEVYPDHEDFAVRTMGMPGLGALGVTFGYVVAMDSPSGRRPGSFHWASTLWHELSHVFVLAATRHRVPRWFTEGMAVHEETAVSPEWGDRLDPESIKAIVEKKLLPVAELDRGFIRPTYPAQVTVSYFQAGRICDYIAGKWGYDKLLDMMHAFAKRLTTPEVIEAQLGIKPEEFDREFLAWLDARTKRTVQGFDDWRKRVRNVAAAAKEKRYEDVIREGLEIRDVYPDYVEAGSVYEFLADAYLAKEEKAKAMAELERYARAGGRNPALLKKLAGLQEEHGKPKEAAATLNRVNYIYPVADEDLHRRLGDLWAKEGNIEGAIREYRAVVALKPVDPAASHYNLAKAYHMAGRRDEAAEHVVLSLEAAPGFRPAQQLLLELNQEQKPELNPQRKK